jgi:adenylylsulfate kinase-like enzyme
MPPTSDKGLWFYSALAALLLGNLILSPFFTKPADAISYAVTGIVALLATSIWRVPGAGAFDRAVWLLTVSYVVAVSIAGLLSIVLKDSERPSLERLARSLYAFCDNVGGPRSIFSVIFLFAILAFHRDSPREFITLGIAWALLIGLRPLETAADLLVQWSAIWGSDVKVDGLGEVVAQQAPGIALVRQTDERTHLFGSLLAVPASDGKLTIGLAADYVGWAEGRWLRVLLLEVPQNVRDCLRRFFGKFDKSQKVYTLAAAHRQEPTIAGCLNSDPLVLRHQGLLGVVAPDTDIVRLRFEILRTDLDLEEGQLVEVRLGKRMVLYQVVNGLTKEAILQQKNIYGFVRGDAKKIGCWNENLKRFEIVKWIPQPNEPVFLVKSETYEASKEAIGHFPGTNYKVEIDPNLLVTHNTAILGVLGSGKSYLALELVERLITEGIKIVALDLTNQYALELERYYDLKKEKPKLDKLAKIGANGKANANKNVEEGGSVVSFAAAVKEDLKEFLAAGAEFLKVYNPATFEVWRQDSKPYQDKASMASLTPTEITRIITESLLELLQDKMSNAARACIVFEEAHSLIPEWNAVASEGDKTATNGTAKAILQGRKYGLGCIVITQRTANVTKSILNQCNTVFALRVFDATGMEFLKNYVGEDYASVLSSLEDRHVVAFGRGSLCRSPVLLRLNDRDQFLETFRAPMLIEGGG